MRWKSLQRAQRYGDTPPSWFGVQGAALLSALTTGILIAVLGLLTDLMVTQGHLRPAAQTVELQEWASEHSISLDGEGLLPSVVRLRGRPVLGTLFRNLYQSSSWWQRNVACLLLLLGGGLLLALVQAFALWMLDRSSRNAALQKVTKLREAIHAQAFRIGGAEVLAGRMSRAQELYLSRSERVLEGLARWWSCVTHDLVLLGVIVLLAIFVNLWLTVTALVFATLTWLLYRALRQHAASQKVVWNDRAAEHQYSLLESLRLVPLVIGYHLDHPPGDPADVQLRRYSQAQQRALYSSSLVMPGVVAFVFLGIGLLLLLVGINVLGEPARMSVAGLVVLGTALVCGYFPLARLARLGEMLSSVDHGAGEIFAFLDREPTVSQVAAPQDIQGQAQDIELQDVRLADRFGHLLLEDVSLKIPAGAHVALLGSNSVVGPAIAGVLLRMFDPAAGRVMIGGQDIRRATLWSLRQNVAFVAGDGMLFSGDVAENIRCGDSQFTQLDVTEAAKKAHVYNFIQQLPQGFATSIDPQGGRIDAGEAFRIGLARAVLRDPKVIIVQEPEEPLDEKGASYIEEALHRIGNGRTVIMLPTQPSTLRRVESIALFHQGKLHAAGSHTDLLQSNELYRHIIYARFNQFKDQVP